MSLSASLLPRGRALALLAFPVLSALLSESLAAQGTGGPPRVVAWNDLGMHCLDPDYSVFAILPPFNNINVQFVVGGQLVESPPPGYTVTFEGVADPTGSINTTSIAKSNFWDHVDDLFGVSLLEDQGLAGHDMPGPANVPQPMDFDALWNWWQAEGVPFTPFDDAGEHNPYPHVRVMVRNGANQLVSETVTTVPNSSELECSACHASGASPFARPDVGWAFHADPDVDDRRNILALHDERHLGEQVYTDALATLGFSASGLLATAQGGTSVLCASCHGSNALPGTGIAGISALTSAVHSAHGDVRMADGRTLDGAGDRYSCYSCHPGYGTKCLRGAMGQARGADGDFSMQCQSCHGSMADVGDPARVGWLEQVTCQNCHTGTATNNGGAIRFHSAFDAAGDPHAAPSDVFATTPDTPAAGFSLYRFSEGHGGLQCSACHGPPHAIYPTASPNDNVQNELLQGHEGTLMECSTCHANLEDDEWRGPHGMHPTTFDWAHGGHGDAAENGALAECRACHGSDDSGTVLSLVQDDRTYSLGSLGTKTFWRGSRIGCYTCHDGPDDDDPNGNARPTVSDLAPSTPSDVPLVLPLGGSDPNGDALELRIVSHPTDGYLAFDGQTATYTAEPGFVGTDTFTYAAWDGKIDSNLGMVTITVGAPDCPGELERIGFGCPGTGDVLPQLDVSGCASPGESVTISITGGLGGANAFLIAGLGQGFLEYSPGCMLRVDPILLTLGPLPLSPGGAGDGALAFPVPLGPNWSTVDVFLQAYMVDPGAANGLYSTTNSVAVRIR